MLRASLLLAVATLFLADAGLPQTPSASGTGTPGALDPETARELKAFQSRTTVKVLPNGLTLVLSERKGAPVFSYFTIVDAGDSNDPTEQSGLAHMFEHLAFKGTEDIGTKDYAAEKTALARLETAYADYDAEDEKRVGQDREAKAAARRVPEGRV